MLSTPNDMMNVIDNGVTSVTKQSFAVITQFELSYVKITKYKLITFNSLIQGVER